MTKRGKVFTAIGLLLLAAALCLTAYNLITDALAGRKVQQTMQELRPLLDKAPQNAQEDAPAPLPETAIAEIPDYLLNPQMEMPVRTVDGADYIGVLDIPALELSLPVISRWSYPSLKLAPCRYTGSAYTNDLVILGHNYEGHFRDLKKLSPGDAISFTDMDGNVFSYEVAALETLAPTAVEEMTSGDWDLTLFTCTVGGSARLAVRCLREDTLPALYDGA